MTVEDDFEDMEDAVEVAASRIQTDLEDAIAEHPFRALACSFVAGLIIAKLFL